MDDPALDESLHRQALVALRRINWCSRTAANLWKPICRMGSVAPGRPLHVLDVASGGGDVAIALATRARRAGLPLCVTGCDVSPVAVRHARQAARSARLDNVEFTQLDVLQGELPPCDVAITSLFLHHLGEDDAQRLLASMAAAARTGVIVSDLRRTRIGYWLGVLASRLLTRSPVVRVDGPLSVAAAFTAAEALDLARRAGLDGAKLSNIWPQRYLLVWRRP